MTVIGDNLHPFLSSLNTKDEKYTQKLNNLVFGLDK